MRDHPRKASRVDRFGKTSHFDRESPLVMELKDLLETMALQYYPPVKKTIESSWETGATIALSLLTFLLPYVVF
jgi:hypothetical protein